MPNPAPSRVSHPLHRPQPRPAGVRLLSDITSGSFCGVFGVLSRAAGLAASNPLLLQKLEQRPDRRQLPANAHRGQTCIEQGSQPLSKQSAHPRLHLGRALARRFIETLQTAPDRMRSSAAYAPTSLAGLVPPGTPECSLAAPPPDPHHRSHHLVHRCRRPPAHLGVASFLVMPESLLCSSSKDGSRSNVIFAG